MRARHKFMENFNFQGGTRTKILFPSQRGTIWPSHRGAKQGGVGGVSTPPEFWMGGLNTCQPPLILRKTFLGGVGSP